jgi:hypothetical protein
VALIGDRHHTFDGGKAGAWRCKVTVVAGRRPRAAALAVPLFLAGSREDGAVGKGTVLSTECRQGMRESEVHSHREAVLSTARQVVRKIV